MPDSSTDYPRLFFRELLSLELKICDFNFMCLLHSDGPIHWPRHHPHSESRDPVLREKRSFPSVSVQMEIYQHVTHICRSFDEEKCSPIRLFSNDPFWKVTNLSISVFNKCKCDNLRGRRPVWTSLEASLLQAWNVAFRQGNTVFLQSLDSTLSFQGTAEPDHTLDWRVKHLRKHWWRCRVLEGAWWKTQGDLNPHLGFSKLLSRRRVNEVVRVLCPLVRGNPLEKWQGATFVAVGKR